MRWFVVCCVAGSVMWYGMWGCSPTIPGNEAQTESSTEVVSETAGESVTGEATAEASAESGTEGGGGAEPAPEAVAEAGAESSTPEAGNETVAETAVETAAEVVAESGAEPTPEPGVEPGNEPAPEAGPEAGPEAVAESVPEGGGSSIPTNGTDLLKYLQAGNYKNWPKESKVHGATLGSPHGAVQVYINNVLDQSLSAGNTTHPVGAASVKELYASDQKTLNGYAVMVKVSQGTGGQTWYWYEIIGSNVVANGTNAGICTGCHSPGVDYFRTKYPLQ